MNAVARHGVSIALACRAFEISETCYRYSPVLSDENEEIADWLERLTANKRPGALACVFVSCATFKAMAGTTNASTGSTATGTKLADQAQEAAEAGQA